MSHCRAHKYFVLIKLGVSDNNDLVEKAHDIMDQPIDTGGHISRVHRGSLLSQKIKKRRIMLLFEVDEVLTVRTDSELAA